MPITFQVHPVFRPVEEAAQFGEQGRRELAAHIGHAVAAATVPDGEVLLRKLADDIGAHAREVLGKLLPGWPDGDDWSAERSRAAAFAVTSKKIVRVTVPDQQEPQELQKVSRLKEAVGADLWDSLDVYVMFTGDGDEAASRNRGVNAVMTSDSDSQWRSVRPHILLWVQVGALGRVLPTLTHELVHYARQTIRPDARKDEALFRSAETMFQEGLAERLVSDLHGESEVLHGRDSFNDEDARQVRAMLHGARLQESFRSVEHWNFDAEKALYRSGVIAGMELSTDLLYPAGYRVVNWILNHIGMTFSELLRWDVRAFVVVAEQELAGELPQ